MESPDRAVLDRFVERIPREIPPLAKIESFESSSIEPQGFDAFTIRESLHEDGRYVLVSPDIAVCDDCLREMKDPSDRRYGYSFINCTNCGPRYSIIEDVPYDRPKTTMRVFPMCEACELEYHDPGDRRFHAQPIACPKCGPSLKLVPSSSTGDGFPKTTEDEDVLRKARALLLQGKILAVRGLGGFPHRVRRHERRSRPKAKGIQAKKQQALRGHV